MPTRVSVSLTEGLEWMDFETRRTKMKMKMKIYKDQLDNWSICIGPKQNFRCQ